MKKGDVVELVSSRCPDVAAGTRLVCVRPPLPSDLNAFGPNAMAGFRPRYEQGWDGGLWWFAVKEVREAS